MVARALKFLEAVKPMLKIRKPHPIFCAVRRHEKPNTCGVFARLFIGAVLVLFWFSGSAMISPSQQNTILGDPIVQSFGQHCSECPPAILFYENGPGQLAPCPFIWMPGYSCIPDSNSWEPANPPPGSDDLLTLATPNASEHDKACLVRCIWWELSGEHRDIHRPKVSCGPTWFKSVDGVGCTGSGDDPTVCNCPNQQREVYGPLPWVDDNGNGVHDFEDPGGMPDKTIEEYIWEEYGLPAGSYNPEDPKIIAMLVDYIRAYPFGDSDGDGMPNLLDSFPIELSPDLLLGGVVDLPDYLPDEAAQKSWLEGFLTRFRAPGLEGSTEFDVPTDLFPDIASLDLDQNGQLYLSEIYGALHKRVLELDEELKTEYLNDPSWEPLVRQKDINNLKILMAIAGAHSGHLPMESASRLIGNLTTVNVEFDKAERRFEEIGNNFLHKVWISGAAQLNYNPETGKLSTVYLDEQGNEIDVDEVLTEYFRDAIRKIVKVGDPVNTANGAFLMKELDFSVPGRGINFNFVRHYDSGSRRRGVLGWKWRVPMLETAIVWHMPEVASVQGVTAYLDWGDGAWSKYVFDAAEEAFIGTLGEYGKIKRYSNHLSDTALVDCESERDIEMGYTLRTPEGLLYHFCPPTYVQGMGPLSLSLLRKVTDPDGNAIIFKRDARGLVYQVIDTMGRVVNFTYTSEGLLDTVTDHEGVSHYYYYDTDKGHLLRVEGPSVNYLDPVSDQMKVGRSFQDYYYQELSTNWGENKHPKINHNLSEVRRSSAIPSTIVEYYGGNNGFSTGRVKAVTEGSDTMHFSYERYPVDLAGPEIPSEASGIRVRTRTIAGDGVQKEFYHREDGLLAWMCVHNARYDSAGIQIPGSGQATGPEEWWTIFDYNSDRRITSTIEKTSEANSPFKKTEFEYQVTSPDRFQHGNQTKVIKHPVVPNHAQQPTARVFETVYDPVTTKPYRSILPTGEITEYVRGHHELSYAEASALPKCVAWGILNNLSAEPEPLMWGQGDVNGDGVLGGTHQLVKKRFPDFVSPVSTSMPAAFTADVEQAETWRYNSAGNVIWQKNSAGVVTETVFTGGYPTKQVFDAEGYAYENEFEFNSYGQVTFKKDAEGLISRSTYDARGLLVKTVLVSESENAHQNCAIDDSSAGVDEECKIEHGLIHKKYRDLEGRIVAAIGPESGLIPWVTNYPGRNYVDSYKEYDSLGRVSKVQENVTNLPGQAPTISVWEILERDGVGRVLKQIDPRGAWIGYSYDSLGREIEVKRGADVNDPGVTVSKYEYAWHGGVAALERPLLNTATENHRVEYEYDEHLRLEKESYPQGLETRHSYNSEGRLGAVEHYEGADLIESVAYLYNTWGDVVQASKTRTKIEHDGSIVPIIGAPQTEVIKRGYSKFRGLPAWFEAEDASSPVQVRFEYDSFGNRKKDVLVHSTDSVEVEYAYDAIGRLTSYTSTLDDRGHQGPSSPSQSTFSYEYDEYGRLRSKNFPDGTKERTVHDKRGYPYFVLRPDGSRTLYKNDSKGRVLEQSDAVAGGFRTYTYEYDAYGNVLSMTEPSGAFSEWDYDSLGRLEESRKGVGTTLEYAKQYYYLPSGLLDYSSGQEGIHTDYEYDVFGRITSRIDTDLIGNREQVSTAILHGPFGGVREISASTGGGAVSAVRYDRASTGEVLARHVIDGHGSAVSTLGYDSVGNVIKETFPGGWSVDRFYDELQRPLRVDVSDIGNDAIVFGGHYGLLRARSLSIVGQYELTAEYDGNGRQVLSKLEDGARLVGQDAYQYYPGGSVKEINVSPQGTQHKFSYDILDRMKSWEFKDDSGAIIRKKEWEYDESNNVEEVLEVTPGGSLTSISTPNILNQITSLTPSIGTVSYLESGEVDLVSNAGSPVREYVWDALGRPTKCTVNSGATSSVISWEYSADGRLRSRSEDNVLTDLFTYSAAGDLVETNGIDGQKRYVFDVVGGNPTICKTSQGVFGVQNSWRGDVRRATNGTIDESYEYSPYGEVFDPSTGFGASPGEVQCLFGGQLPDRILGTVRFGQRTLDPELGRFISRDPIGVLGGTNLYEFALSNPWKYGDPSGLAPAGLQEAFGLLLDNMHAVAAGGSEDTVAGREYIAISAGFEQAKERLGFSEDVTFDELSDKDKLRVVEEFMDATSSKRAQNLSSPERYKKFEEGMSQLSVWRAGLLWKIGSEQDLLIAAEFTLATADLALDIADLPSVAAEMALIALGADTTTARNVVLGVTIGVGVVTGGAALWAKLGKKARQVDVSDVWIVTPEGTAIPKSQKKMKQMILDAGGKKIGNARNGDGEIFRMPTAIKDREMDVRVMDGTAGDGKHSGARSVFTEAGTPGQKSNQGVYPSGEPVRGSVSKSNRRRLSHVHGQINDR